MKVLRGQSVGNINLVESDRFRVFSRVLLVLWKGFSPYVCTRFEGVACWEAGPGWPKSMILNTEESSPEEIPAHVRQDTNISARSMGSVRGGGHGSSHGRRRVD